jgi:hypothetical protein
MKGYKVFNPNWTCKDYQYKVGATHETTAKIELCEKGFHFCKRLVDCFTYYPFDPENKVAEVEALGDVIESDCDSKCVTNKIKIIKELSWNDVLDMVNIGQNNTGFGNVGNRNVGTYNTGNCNKGSYNTGDTNSGHDNTGSSNAGVRNTGNGNTGNDNTGDRNIGCFNTGDYNLGNHNTGDFNLTDWATGVFCTEPQKIKIFDKETNMTIEEWLSSDACRILYRIRPVEYTWWESMTEEEKHQHPEAKITGGYLKTINFEEACKIWWNELTDEEKDIIKAIPNFDPEKFKLITGIDVTKEELH